MSQTDNATNTKKQFVLNDVTLDPQEELYRRLAGDKWNQTKKHRDYKKPRPRRLLLGEGGKKRIDFSLALDVGDDDDDEDIMPRRRADTVSLIA